MGVECGGGNVVLGRGGEKLLRRMDERGRLLKAAYREDKRVSVWGGGMW